MVRISDGRMSGTGFGTVILHVSPESAAGGPLNWVQNGDYILIYTPMTTRYDWWNLYGPELYPFFQNLMNGFPAMKNRYSS